MGKYSRDEFSDALQVVSSTISKCEKIQPKFPEGTSQYTLLKNRIKAMYISRALITEDREIERYSKEELIGRRIVMINNLEPALIRGEESQGMILAATDENNLSVLGVEKEIAPGSMVK